MIFESNQSHPDWVAFLLEKTMTKEEAMTVITQCAVKLGHTPSVAELKDMGGLERYHLRRLFGSHRGAVEACNLQTGGAGYELTLDELFLDWARVVRVMRKIPTVPDYQLMSKYSPAPLTRRFRSWLCVPHGMKQHAERQGLAEEWKDVLEIVSKSNNEGEEGGSISGSISGSGTALKVPFNGPVYGPLIQAPGVAHGPVNEMGVVFLFGAMAERLGFVVHRIQAEFPDCEAMQNIGNDRWQRVRIEFEYESRNFLKHMHDIRQCDLIICWRHNWPECPLEVLELKSVLQ
jgi:hypothetical protein